MYYLIIDATDTNSPSMAQWCLSGTSSPEIAGNRREYREILIPCQSHKSIVPSVSLPPEDVKLPFCKQLFQENL